MAKEQAKFRLLGYTINDASIKFDYKTDSFENLSIGCEQESGVDEKNKAYQLKMSINVDDDKRKLAIKIHVIAVFEFDADLDEKQKKSFFNVNAQAIIFPFIRAYITSLTALSGIQPIILPTINFAAIAKEAKEK